MQACARKLALRGLAGPRMPGALGPCSFWLGMKGSGPSELGFKQIWVMGFGHLGLADLGLTQIWVMGFGQMGWPYKDRKNKSNK